MPKLFSAAFIFSKTRLAAVFTVEAALLMALILPVLLSLIYLGFLDHDRGVLQGAACEAASLADNSALDKARADKLRTLTEEILHRQHEGPRPSSSAFRPGNAPDRTDLFEETVFSRSRHPENPGNAVSQLQAERKRGYIVNITVIKETDQAYLSLDGFDPQEYGYTVNMVQNCPLEGLLPIHIFFCDGKSLVRYRITGFTSLTERFNDSPLRLADLRNILYTLRDICQRLPEYLLSSEDLLLDPEKLFISPVDSKVHVCYIPGLPTMLPSSRMLLAEFLLKRADHADQLASALVYRFYDQVSENSRSLSDALAQTLQSQPDPDSNPGSAASSTPLSGCPSGESPSPVFQNTAESGISAAHASCASKPSSVPHPHPSLSDTGCPTPRPAVPKVIRERMEHDRKTLILLLLAFSLLGIGCAVALKMDAAQIGGIGFLTASVIWLVRQQQVKKRSELRNIWSDEEQEMEDDDTFYRSLLREVYADQDNAPQGPPFYPRDNIPPGSPSFPQGSISQDSKSFPVNDTPAGSSCLQSLSPEQYNDIPLHRRLLIIGKSPRECDICLKSDTVSRIHARIERVSDTYYLTDLFSTNGTFLDGRRLEPNHASPIPPGAEIRIAGYRYRANL